jgi:hypothetical protein
MAETVGLFLAVFLLLRCVAKIATQGVPTALEHF